MLYTYETGAIYLNCKPKTLYRLIHDGLLHHTRVGNRVMFTQAHLDAYLKSGDTNFRKRR